MKKTIPVLWFLCLFSSLLQADTYRVTDEVLREDPPYFGLNFGLAPFKPWTKVYNNVWNDFYAMEPIVFRWNFTATGGGEDYIENAKGEPATNNPARDRNARSAGAGYYYQMHDGFWDGAQVDIYRPTEDGLVHIRRDKVKRFLSPRRGEEGEERLHLEGTGEPVQAGDIYDLLMVRDEVPEGVARPKGQRNGFFRPSPNSGVTWRIDSTTHSPENGSTASMRVDLPGGSNKPVGMTHQYLRWGGEHNNFKPGRPYRFEAWMKGNVDAPVVIEIGDRGSKQLDLTDEWQKISFELDSTTPIFDDIGWLTVGSTGAGTFWLDNMIVYQSDLEPFAIYPEWIEAMQDYKVGLIRDMGGRGTLTMDNFLTRNQFERNFLYSNTGVVSGWFQGNMTLPVLLELCEETGADPYIMTYVLWTDEEIELFMEYLGGPVDTPGGALRAEHGHPQPWTEVFDRIYIECANEMWNQLFVPQAFPSQPEVAGMVSDRLFRKIKESPYANDKFRYVASAFVHSLYRWKDGDEYNMNDRARAWTFRNLITSPNANAIATAPSGYIGGWDGDTPVGQDDEQLFQSNLLYPAQIMHPKLDEILAMQEELTEQYGRGALEMIKYEAGPGYALPSPEKPFMEETERIGKSLALGTATLDNFLFVLANNGNANYYKFSGSDNWASHTRDMIPHNTYLALSLRKFCEGDMLKVDDVDVGTIDIPEMQSIGLDNQGKRRKKVIPAVSGVPLTQLYAFREGGRYSFIGLNRSATEPQEITIDLPYEPQSQYTLHTYAHEDIRANNRTASSPEEMELKINTYERDGFKNGFTFNVPPASAFVIVNQAK